MDHNTVGGADIVVVSVSPENVGNTEQEPSLETASYASIYVSTDDVEGSRLDGLDVDYYVGEIEVALSSEQKHEKQRKYVEQEPQTTTLIQSLPNTTTVIKDSQELKENLDILKGDNNPRKNLTKDQLELLTQSMWLHVPMPKQFGYTGAILANDTFQGLLHTFARHWNQWQEYPIPGLRELIANLPEDIHPFLEQVKNANNRYTSRAAINELKAAIDMLQDDTNIIVDLLEIQLKLHDFLAVNVTYSQYLGEGVNGKGNIQVYFQVTQREERNNEPAVMVVCVSNQLFPAIAEFNDYWSRPVRSIITVFFQSIKEFNDNDAEFHVGKTW